MKPSNTAVMTAATLPASCEASSAAATTVTAADTITTADTPLTPASAWGMAIKIGKPGG
jgi:hypothetical protein